MKNTTKKETENLNLLTEFLGERLQSSGKIKKTDSFGITTYTETDVFSKSLLSSFIKLSISEFNQTPYFTNFTLESSKFVETFSDIIVEGAVLYALSSQALLERGREFMIKDDGISFNPPQLAEMLHTQYATLLNHHWNKVKHIKSAFNDDAINNFS